MIHFSIIFLIYFGCFAAQAECKADEPCPENQFSEDLAKAEAKYVASVRTKAEKAASIQISRISPEYSEVDPFNETAKGFEMISNGKTVIYPVIKSGDAINDGKTIEMWANAVLPEQQLPLTLCTPAYGYAVSFFDSRGKNLYRCTICLDCLVASMEFPRYSARIGVRVNTIKELLKLAGFEPEIPKSQPAAPPGGIGPKN